MCPSKVHVVREKLREIVSFLEPLKPLANAHMTGFITQNCWEILPEDIKTEVVSLSRHELYELFWGWGSNPKNFHHTSAVGKFLKDCWHFSLSSDYFNDLMLFYENREGMIKYSKCMSPKKFHEVSTLKEIVAYLCESTMSNCVVDVGGGKGYFGASMVLEKKMKVLSIDSKSQNTEGAVHIFGKIEKHQGAYGNSDLLYKQATAFVTAETNLKALAQESFESTSEHKICLTGLHVCGNLASTCLQLFCKNEDVLSVCSIGCCYNLLTEKFENNTNADGSQSDFGFPLSDFLKKLKYCLGRNARMIACQPIDRICLEKRVMKPSLFWRAAIQVHFEELFGPKCDLSVGRRCSKTTCFTDYCLKVEQSFATKLGLTEEKINKLSLLTEKHYDDMVKFYCLRLAVAPVVEALIILDRLLYLLEQDLDNAYICKAFDGATSPRCHAIISMKT